MHLKSTVLMAFLFTLAACGEEQARRALPYESFSISCGTDTVLHSSSGMQLIVKSSSFDCGENEKPIQIQFLPIRNKADIIKYGAYTVDENGAILESGGMFKIELGDSEQYLTNKGIQVRIPSSHIDERMQLFRSEDEEPSWALTAQEVEMPDLPNLKQGERLFKAKCASCHDHSLKRDLTGPALANVTLYRDMDWLIEFTRNSQQMIASGDTLARCLWQSWRPVIMNNFMELSDAEIKNIYAYIENDSKKRGIGKDDVSFTMDCTLKDSTVPNILRDTSIRPTQAFLPPNDSLYTYLARINASGWYNVDYFWDFDNEIENLLVELPEAKTAGTNIVLSFKNRNIVIPFRAAGSNNYILLNSQGKPKINFPEEAVEIIAYRILPGENFISESAVLDYQLKKKGNKIKLNLEPTNAREFFSRLEEK